MHRHAGHRDRRTTGAAALGQGDVQQPRGLARVVVEQLVEIAHAEEQQQVGVVRLGGEELLHQRGVLGGARAEFGFVFGVGGLQERCPEIWRSINLAVDGSQAARGGGLATPVWRRCAKKANALSRPTDPLRWNGRGAVAGVHLAVEGASLSRHGKKTSVRRPQADRSGLHVRAGALIRALLGSSHRLRWSAGRDDERLNSRADSERLTSPLRSPPDACGRYAVWHPWRRASRLLACAAHPHLRTAPHGFCRSLLDQGKCFCSRVFVFANTW